MTGGPADAARAAGAPAALLAGLLERFPPAAYERGETLIGSTPLETVDFDTGGLGGAPPAPGESPRAGFVVEGLVRGVWDRNTLAPASRATAIVAGDGRWIGADAFRFGKNIFRYDALTPTLAAVFPLSWVHGDASREILLHALRSVSLNWLTMASVMSLGTDTLARRTLLLLYDLSRLHPRPELEVRQKDIADMLGVTRQTLQPVLKDLERRGLVALGYGEIVIADPADLVRRLRRKG